MTPLAGEVGGSVSVSVLSCPSPCPPGAGAAPVGCEVLDPGLLGEGWEAGKAGSCLPSGVAFAC